MQLKQPSPTILLLKDKPGCFWLFSMFFIALGGLVLAGLLGLFTDLGEISLSGKILTWVLALSATGAGIFQLYRSPGSRSRFDHEQGKMVILRRGLFRKEKYEYRLDEIEEIILAETTDIDGDPVHQLRMQLKSGQEVRLSSLWLHNKGELELVREKIQEFLSIN